jgi:hypothetical protein
MAKTCGPDLGNERDSNSWVNIPEWSNSGATIHHLYGMGQHPRRVGQHKTEGWVNMVQNIQQVALTDQSIAFVKQLLLR